MSDAPDTDETPAADDPEFVLMQADDSETLAYLAYTSGPEWDEVFDIETNRARRASSRPA